MDHVVTPLDRTHADAHARLVHRLAVTLLDRTLDPDALARATKAR